MKNKYLIHVFVIYFIGLIEGGPPKLYVPKEYIFTISKNITNPSSLSKLIMTCSGDKPLRWDYKIPDYGYYSWKGKTVSFLRASGTRPTYIGSEHFSTITVFEPTKYYTGYFNCYYYQKAGGAITSTYVYLDDKGGGFVLDNDSPHIIVRPPGGPIQINCRTTRPDIEVKVLVGEEEVPQNMYEFDPRRGVIFEDVNDIPNYTQHEEIKCINKNKSEFSILTFVLTSKPLIEKHRNSHIVVGEDFALNCLIAINIKYNPEFYWDFPNKIQAHTEMKISGNKTFSVSTLKIKSANVSYSGSYRCEVSLGYKPAVSFKAINVSEYIVPFVQFLEKNDTQQHEHFVNEGDNFKWVIQFEGYPRNLTYTFSHPNKIAFPHEDKRVTTNFAYEEGILSLEIKRITAEDWGNYSVRLEAPNGIYDENFVFLAVNVTPKIELSDIASLLPANEHVSITALITTNKIQPKVNWWFYSDCPKGIGSCDGANGMMLSNSLEKYTGSLNRYKSVASLRPSTSGELVCEFSSIVGVNDTRMYLNVSDKTEAFFVTVRTETDFLNLTHHKLSKTINAIEGDNIVIECFALDFLFDNITFNYSELKSYEEVCDTELSLGRCLNIKNIDIGEEWLIECTAQTRVTSKVEKISFRIDVVDMIAPRVLLNSTVSVDGKVTSVKLPYPFFIACYVEGRPKAKITWLKDGVNIQKFLENKDYVFLRDGNQTLEFTFSTKEDGGKYECIVENRAGRIHPFTNVLIDGNVLTPFEICFVVLSITSCVVVIFLVIMFKGRKKFRIAQLDLLQSKVVGDLNSECTIGEQIEMLPYDNTYEVKIDNIRLGKQLGAGAFGRVLLAEVKGLEGRPSTRVAVKMCRDGGDKTHLRALTLELKIMIHLGKHLNIVNLLGAHTSNIDKSELWLLVEYCKYGNLLKFIQRAKAQFIDQINTVTGEINVHKTSPFNNETLSRTSLLDSAGASNLDSDGHLGEDSECSMNIDLPSKSHPSATSITGTTEPNHTSWSDPASKGEHSVLPPDNPLPRRRTSTPNSGSEFEFFMMLASDMTLAPSPRPFSPTPSCKSDSQEEPITSYTENIPGVSAPFTTTDIVCWAWQVANGMQYLTRRNVLHGDLAARNLLLADDNVVKICDFGLSRDMYQNDVYVKKSKDNIMPIKWMAPESIQQKIFSIQSDVWAYGITLWEMFTLGDSPYSGVPIDQEFLFALQEGMRLEKPKHCNEEIYNLLLDCWQLNPFKRPSFSRIVNLLSDILSPERKQHYVNMNNVYKQKNEEWLSKNEDYLKIVKSPDFKNLQSALREEGVIPDPLVERCVVDSDYLDAREWMAEEGELPLESEATATPEYKLKSFPPSTKAGGPNNEKA